MNISCGKLNLQFAFLCICSIREDWRPLYGQNQYHGQAEIWITICTHISSFDSRQVFYRLWTLIVCLRVLCLCVWFLLLDFCLFWQTNATDTCNIDLTNIFDKAKYDIQFLISDMNTDKPRIPSPFTGGVIIDRAFLNCFKQPQKNLFVLEIQNQLKNIILFIWLHLTSFALVLK